jgi:hypothetical protein
LISLNGIVANPEDDVNCDIAEDIGNKIQSNWNNLQVTNATVKRSDQIKTLANIHNVYSLDSGKAEIDASSLFHRLVILAQQSENVASCFAYELTPYPTSLFKNGLMRKPNKPALYEGIAAGFTSSALPADIMYIVDGGCLLHKVRWHKGISFDAVMQVYVNYAYNKFGNNACIVFDGYDSSPSTKDHEHKRRAGKTGLRICQ